MEKIEIFIRSLGILAPLVYIIIYMLLTTTCISVVPLSLIGGAIFGPIFGIIYTVIGAGLGLSLSFLIARYLAKDKLEKKFGNTEIFKKINNGIKDDGWFILAITRFLPIFPFGIQNYVYGLTSINFWLYATLSTLFILPGTSVFILIASAATSGNIKSASKMAIIASLIFLALAVITKLITKKNRK